MSSFTIQTPGLISLCRNLDGEVKLGEIIFSEQVAICQVTKERKENEKYKKQKLGRGRRKLRESCLVNEPKSELMTAMEKRGKQKPLDLKLAANNKKGCNG